MSSSSMPSSTTAANNVPFTVNPTATVGPNTQPSGGGTSSSLYLFTFLATLLLLLCVSSAIILRSFLLRRRFRRRVEHAILTGAYGPSDLDPFAPGRSSRRRRDFGAKPRMFNVFPSPSLAPATWGTVVPVSAVPLPPDPEKSSPQLQQQQQQEIAPYPPPRPGRLARLNLNPFSRAVSPPREPTPPPTPPSADAMQVTLLIAMPDLRRHDKLTAATGDEEEELPEIVLGTTAVPYRDHRP